MELSDKRNTKRICFEIMRIFACFFVLYNHLPAYHLYLSAENMSGLRRIPYMLLSAFTKFSVPLFFMISGAVLLGKKESAREILHKRVSRILIVIFLVNLVIFIVYTLNRMAIGEEFSFSLSYFILGVLSDSLPGAVPYWYLYSYACFLLVLPILRRIAQGLNDGEFAVLAIGMMVGNFLEPLLYVFQFIIKKDPVHVFFPMPFLESSVFFPLAGYYLDQKVDVSKIKGKHFWGISVISIIGAVFACVFTYCDKFINGHFTQNYIGSFSWLHAIAAFILIKYLAEYKFSDKLHGRTGRFLRFAGSLTFGIYLLDPILKFAMVEWYPQITTAENVPVFISSVAWCLLSILVGGIITWILKKTPKIRELL